MSVETKLKLDEAIAAHVADETGGAGAMITGYMLIASATSLEDIGKGRTGYWTEFGDNQPYHVSLGLARKMALDMDHQNFHPDEDEDEE